MDSKFIHQQEAAGAKANVQLGFLLAIGFAIFSVVISLFFIHGVMAVIETTALGA